MNRREVRETRPAGVMCKSLRASKDPQSLGKWFFRVSIKNVKVLIFQLVEASSAVSFTANYLQSRVVSTELGAQLAKLYEILGTKRPEEFEQKLDELTNESTAAGLLTNHWVGQRVPCVFS